MTRKRAWRLAKELDAGMQTPITNDGVVAGSSAARGSADRRSVESWRRGGGRQVVLLCDLESANPDRARTLAAWEDGAAVSLPPPSQDW